MQRCQMLLSIAKLELYACESKTTPITGVASANEVMKNETRSIDFLYFRKYAVTDNDAQTNDLMKNA